MRPLPLLLTLLLLLGASFLLRAQPPVPITDYIINATTIVRVQVEDASSTDQSPLPPPPRGQRRAWVKEVLKGVDTTQQFLVPDASFVPGQEAFVLLPYEQPVRSEVAVRQKRENPLPAPIIWPVDAATGKVNRGFDTPFQPPNAWTFNQIEPVLIRESIAKSSPEQIGLNAYVLDAVLFPERLQILAKENPRWEKFVRMAATVYHVEHDVPALAALLESRDPEVRAAATRKLEALTGDQVPAIADAEKLRAWVEAQAQRLAPKPQDRWPAVPENLQMPPDAFPPALLAALEQKDADAFAREFAFWMAGGVRRDRSISLATSDGMLGNSGWNIPAPRLDPETLLGLGTSAGESMKGIAMFAQVTHFDRFARERAAASDLIPNRGKFKGLTLMQRGSIVLPDSSMYAMNTKLFPTKGGADTETLRRAAFWEISDRFNQFPDPSRDAINRLAEREDEETQRFVLALCLNPEGRAVKDAALTEIQLDHQPFVREMLAYMRSHRDGRSQQIAEFFDESGRRVTGDYHFDRLRNAHEAKERRNAALQLSYYPPFQAGEDLIAIYRTEADPEVKQQILMALAQTGEPQGLDILLGALPGTTDKAQKIEVLRGLGHIRDKRVLPLLSDLVGNLPGVGESPNGAQSTEADTDMRREAAQIFGWVAGYEDVFPPTGYGISSGIMEEWIKRDLDRVQAWREKGELPPAAKDGP